MDHSGGFADKQRSDRVDNNFFPTEGIQGLDDLPGGDGGEIDSLNLSSLIGGQARADDQSREAVVESGEMKKTRQRQNALDFVLK